MNCNKDMMVVEREAGGREVDKYFEEKEISRQGCVPSPLVFNLFVDNLVKELTETNKKNK